MMPAEGVRFRVIRHLESMSTRTSTIKRKSPDLGNSIVGLHYLRREGIIRWRKIPVVDRIACLVVIVIVVVFARTHRPAHFTAGSTPIGVSREETPTEKA